MNLFLPVYKRLEEDVIKLTDSIFFDDDQLKVYSLAIGVLLIRCVIEVEAISKEMYLRLGGVEHSSSQWQQAYQAVKHYRTKFIKRALYLLS